MRIFPRCSFGSQAYIFYDVVANAASCMPNEFSALELRARPALAFCLPAQEEYHAVETLRDNMWYAAWPTFPSGQVTNLMCRAFAAFHLTVVLHLCECMCLGHAATRHLFIEPTPKWI